MPPRAICWSICPETPDSKTLDLNRSGSRSVGLPLAFAAPEPVDQHDRADGQDGQNGLAAFLPDQDAQHDAAHGQDGQDGAHHANTPGARVGDVMHELDARQHDRDNGDLEENPDAP